MASPLRPAIALVSTPGKRHDLLELGREADRMGFAGIACPSMGTTLGLAASLAHVTGQIRFWTAVQPIYTVHPVELARWAAHVAEVSAGRLGLGLGVSHEVVTRRLDVATGRPLADMHGYVDALRAELVQLGFGPPAASPADPPGPAGGTLPLYLAAMRDRMLGLATEVADGAVWANAALSAMPTQLARVPAAAGASFFRANMLPTVIDADQRAADAVNRRTMATYLRLPNYREYWRASGYPEEIEAVEAALAARDMDGAGKAMHDRWLRDVTLGGPPGAVLEGMAAWSDAGVLPVAVMSSTTGGQARAVRELFELYR